MPSNHLILCRPLLLPSISGSFPMSRLFELGGPSIGTSVPASVLPVNIQGWFPLGLTELLLCVKCHTRCFAYAFPSNPPCQHGSHVLVPWCTKHEMLSVIRCILISETLKCRKKCLRINVLSRSVVSNSVTLWAVACQALLSMGFSQQKYCSGLPFPPPLESTNVLFYYSCCFWLNSLAFLQIFLLVPSI